MAKKTKLTKIDTKNEEKKRKRILTFKQTSFLYFLCGVCWIISGILKYVSKESPWFDIIVGLVFVIIGFLYLFRKNEQ